MINDEIELVITEINGDKVKLGIVAPKDIKVLRKELYQTVVSNKEAALGAKTAAVQGLLANLQQQMDDKEA
jgi:carbon storage regulator